MPRKRGAKAERDIADDRMTADLFEAVRLSEAKYRLIVESALDYAIFTLTSHGIIDSWPAGAAAVFGWSADEILGKSFHATFTDDDLARGAADDELATAARNGVAPDVRWHRRKDGTRVCIEGTTRALCDEAGRLRGFLKIGQDVTERRGMDETLRSNEQQFRSLVENIRDYAIMLLDSDGIIVHWTPAAERVKGYRADEALGRHLSLFYTPEDVAAGEPQRELSEAAATGRAERHGWRIRKGGERFWVEEIVTSIRDASGNLTGFTKIGRDLTERRLSEAVADRIHAETERKALRRQLARAEEDERRRLSRELHDEAGQHLTAIGLGLQALSDIAPAGSDIDRRAAQLRELVNRLGQDLHAIAVRLRPKALDDFGLHAALSSYAQEWSRHSGVAVEIHAPDESPRLPMDVESAVYRIVQEAFTNVAKHSGASRVSVVVQRSDKTVFAVIEDDGTGFQHQGPTDAQYGANEPGRAELGLVGIRERVELLGGSLDIESAPDTGTTLFVQIPVAVAGTGGR